MGLDRVKEKANRVAQEVDARRDDRTKEAKDRLDAGKQTLLTILESPASAQNTVTELANTKGEAVGKITQVMVDIAPQLQQDPGRVRTVIARLEEAKNAIEINPKSLEQSAGNVQSAMGSLLDNAKIPTTVLPRNPIADLVADSHADPDKEQRNGEAGGAPDPRRERTPPRTQQTRKNPGTTTEGDGRTRQSPKKPRIASIAKDSGFLNSFSSPKSLVQAPMDAVNNPLGNGSAGGGRGPDAISQATQLPNKMLGQVNEIANRAMQMPTQLINEAKEPPNQIAGDAMPMPGQPVSQATGMGSNGQNSPISADSNHNTDSSSSPSGDSNADSASDRIGETTRWELVLGEIAKLQSLAHKPEVGSDGKPVIDPKTNQPVFSERGASGEAVEVVTKALGKIEEIKSKLETSKLRPKDKQKLKDRILSEARSATEKALRANNETDHKAAFGWRESLFKRFFGSR